MKRLFFIFVGALSLSLFGCGDDVGSEEDAERAYLGLDKTVDRSMQLGFDGFNSASNATIAPQAAKGTATGTMTISGKVDQGASANKTMTLSMQLIDYSDDAEITYNTAGTLPVID